MPYLREILAKSYDSRECAAIISLLIEEVVGISRNSQLIYPNIVIPADKCRVLKMMGERLREGEPVQYILGYETFHGRKFFVDQDTLIPRPETAELVSWIIEENGSKRTEKCCYPAPKTILDVGTGCGCIAITLAATYPDSTVTAIDISSSASKTAKNNAAELKVKNIRFIEQNFFRLVENHAAPTVDVTFQTPEEPLYDLIVSNPPYVTISEAAEIAPNVLDYEPHSALFVPDNDALKFYRAIARYGHKHLNPGGRLYFEINARFGREVTQLLEREGYKDIYLKQDINGRDRMVAALRPE